MASGVLLVCFLALIAIGEGSRILVVLPSPSFSHHVVYNRYLQELHRRGHHLTVVTPFPIDTTNLTNYRQIGFKSVADYWMSIFNISSGDDKLVRIIPEVTLLFLFQPILDMCRMYLSHPEMKTLWEREKFDLFVGEWGTFPCLLPYMARAGNVSVGITSFALGAWSHYLLGSSSNPAFVPEIGLPYSDRMTFFERFRNTFLYFNIFMFMSYLNLKSDGVMREYLGKDVPNCADFEKEVGVVLTHAHFTTQRPRPFATNIIPIGGPAFHLHGYQSQPLPQCTRGRAVMKFLIFAFLLSVAGLTSGADILALFPTPSFSHQIVYRRYMLELHRRGHNMTVITTDPMRDPTLKNYKEIDVSFYYEHWNRRFQVATDQAKFLRWIPEIFVFAFTEAMEEMCEMYLSHPEVRRLISEDARFDLFIVEFGVSSCFYPFARHSRNNFIGIFSMSHGVVVHSNIGNIASASYLPDPLLGELSQMGFLKRLRTVVYQAFGWLVYHYVMRDHTRIARKHFGEDIPATVVYERNVSAILLNNHFTVTFPRPMVPNLIDIGGPAFHLLRRTAKPLPQDIQKFMDEAKHGVVYFSLGSNVKSEAMPESKRRVFIDAFKRLKEKVLWKWEADVLPGKPDNVKIGKWLPQTDILAHPNLKAFVTQGGLQSVSEATYNAVPMVVIPFFADQELNTKRLTSEGVAIRVDYETLDFESFSTALNEILRNREYKERIVRYSALTQDQPQSPLDRAVWWTEYVIRHKGARHLRSAVVDMPWYQYLLLDVIGFILFVLFVIFYLLYVICKLVKRILFGNKIKKD